MKAHGRDQSRGMPHGAKRRESTHHAALVLLERSGVQSKLTPPFGRNDHHDWQVLASPDYQKRTSPIDVSLLSRFATTDSERREVLPFLVEETRAMNLDSDTAARTPIAFPIGAHPPDLATIDPIELASWTAGCARSAAEIERNVTRN